MLSEWVFAGRRKLVVEKLDALGSEQPSDAMLAAVWRSHAAALEACLESEATEPKLE